MKIAITYITLSLFAALALVNSQELPLEQQTSNEYDVCSRQGFYSCKLSLGCYYDGATASCKKVQPKVNTELTAAGDDHCKNLGFYACSTLRGCTLDGNGKCTKISASNEATSTHQKPTPNADHELVKEDDLCSRLGFYACSSDKGCWIDPYTGRCAKIPSEVQQYHKEEEQTNSNKLNSADDLCSRLGFYACSSDKGCWIDPYIGHCAKIPQKIQSLQSSDNYDHCKNLGFYACSSSRGCTLDGNGRCKKIQP